MTQSLSHAASHAAQRPGSKARRTLYNVLGMVCVAVGIVGVFVPVLPTTGPVILASILFAKANPRMHAWLLSNRLLGPYLDNWHNKTGITMGHKIGTCAVLWAGLGVSMVVVSAVWLRVLLAVVGVAVTWHVFSLRTRRPGADAV